MAEVDHHTWAPPKASPPELPKQQDRVDFAAKIGVDSLEYSEFIANGVWDVDDVLRPIYEEEAEKAGREFPYPGDE
jgi:ribonuclease Z